MKHSENQRQSATFNIRKLALASLCAVGASVPAALTHAATNEEPESAKIEVTKGKSDVQVEQPAPTVEVDQKKAEVDVEVGEAEVDIERKKPEISVNQPKPEVDVTQAEPDVTVNTAEPQVTVNKAEPEVRVEKSEPEINIVRKDQQGELKEGSDAANIMQLEVSDLEGKTLKNSDGKEIGEIANVVKNTSDNRLSLVIESGGFLGLGDSKSVLPVEEAELQGDAVVWSGNGSSEALPRYNESQYQSVPESAGALKDAVAAAR